MGHTFYSCWYGLWLLWLSVCLTPYCRLQRERKVRMLGTCILGTATRRSATRSGPVASRDLKAAQANIAVLGAGARGGH